jgi:hypothetical protein
VSAPAPLRLLSLEDAEIGLDDVIVRPRQSGATVPVVMALGMAGYSVREAVNGDLGWAWPAAMVLLLAGVAWLALDMRRRTRRAGAWQMAIGRERVLIRYSSVRSDHLPASALQVIELPFAQVRSVRRMRRTVEENDGDKLRRWRHEFLDFRVKDRDLRPLQAVLLEEQQEHASTWFRRRNPAVAVTSDGVLRVETSFLSARTDPGTDEILRLLAEHVPREEDARENIDLTHPERLSPEAQDEALRAVGETNPHRALRLAREMQPAAPPEEAESRVARLTACPAPSFTPAAATVAAPPPAPVADADAASTLPAPRILARAEAPLLPDDRIVRPLETRLLVVALVMFALAGLVAWRYQAGAMGWGWAALGAGFFALLGLTWVAMWISTLRQDAWLLAIGRERILVHLRSSRRRPPGEPRLLELPWARIASVRLTRQKRSRPSPTGSGTVVRFHTFLDLRVRDLDLGPLREALAHERTLDRAAAYRDADPVMVVDDDVVRVEVASRNGSTRPGHAEVLRLLGERVPVEDEVSEHVETGGTRNGTRRVTPPPREP